jgi:hypothetical protein
MVRSISADELLRSARHAAGTANVREAVRDLTLHALRSRLLTAEHIARVARTVGEGIESSALPPVAPVRETRRGAWAGLEDAVCEALHALEVAAREFAEGRASLTPGERDRMLAELAEMERSLGTGWNAARSIPASLSARSTSVTALLRQAVTSGTAANLSPESTLDAGRALSLMASGVLLGLVEAFRDGPAGAHR